MDIWSVKRIAAELSAHNKYEEREARNIAGLVWTEVFHYRKSDEIDLSHEDQSRMAQITQRLRDGEPVQYIIGYTWFYGLKLNVSPDVLIPRPETEELVYWILTDQKEQREEVRILDIGTGSGCIPIILKKYLGVRAEIVSIDISKEALQVAAENANSHELEIKFLHHDFLSLGFSDLGTFDIIVSNPPYISTDHVSETLMLELKHEPPAALYPAGDDPDIFYKKILTEGNDRIRAGGACYLELNEFRAEAIRDLAVHSGWKNIYLQNDLQGKPRTLKVS